MDMQYKVTLNSRNIRKVMESATSDDMPENFHPERAGIGTPATRAEVIEKLLWQEYIIRKDKLLLPTEKGLTLIKILSDNDSVKSPLLTAKWESDLKRVENGELSSIDFMKAVTGYVRNTVSSNQVAADNKKHLVTQRAGATSGEVLGKCLRCSNDVEENKVAYSYVNRNCKFAVWKDSKFFTAKKKKLTKDIAIALINERRIFMFGLYSVVCQKCGKWIRPLPMAGAEVSLSRF